MSLSELMIDIPAEHEANVFGQFDAYAKKLERTFHVTLIARDGSMKIVGENTAAEKTHRVLTQLLELSRRGNTITEQNVDYAISLGTINLSNVPINRNFTNPLNTRIFHL